MRWDSGAIVVFRLADDHLAMAGRRESLAGDEEEYEFEGFITEDKDDQLASMKKQLMGLVRWRGVMENWRKELGAKVEVLSDMCGVTSGVDRPRPVSDSLEAVMARVDELASENVALKAQLKEYEGHLSEEVKGISEVKNEWTRVESATMVALEEIVKEQKEEREKEKKEFEKNVVQVLKKKEKVVRETIDRGKCVVIFGDVEEHLADMKVRKERDVVKVKGILDYLDEGYGWVKELEEVRRLGIYKKGEMRPLRVELKFRSTAEAVANVSWKLNSTELNHIRVKKDLSVEEREQLRELQAKADEENGKLSEEQKKIFFWRIREGQVRKWYIRSHQEPKVRGVIGKETERQVRSQSKETEREIMQGAGDRRESQDVVERVEQREREGGGE